MGYQYRTTNLSCDKTSPSAAKRGWKCHTPWQTFFMDLSISINVELGDICIDIGKVRKRKGEGERGREGGNGILRLREEEREKGILRLRERGNIRWRSFLCSNSFFLHPPTFS